MQFYVGMQLPLSEPSEADAGRLHRPDEAGAPGPQPGIVLSIYDWATFTIRNWIAFLGPNRTLSGTVTVYQRASSGPNWPQKGSPGHVQGDPGSP